MRDRVDGMRASGRIGPQPGYRSGPRRNPTTAPGAVTRPSGGMAMDGSSPRATEPPHVEPCVHSACAALHHRTGRSCRPIHGRGTSGRRIRDRRHRRTLERQRDRRRAPRSRIERRGGRELWCVVDCRASRSTCAADGAWTRARRRRRASRAAQRPAHFGLRRNPRPAARSYPARPGPPRGSGVAIWLCGGSAGRQFHPERQFSVGHGRRRARRVDPRRAARG